MLRPTTCLVAILLWGCAAAQGPGWDYDMLDEDALHADFEAADEGLWDDRVMAPQSSSWDRDRSESWGRSPIAYREGFNSIATVQADPKWRPQQQWGFNPYNRWGQGSLGISPHATVYGAGGVNQNNRQLWGWGGLGGDRGSHWSTSSGWRNDDNFWRPSWGSSKSNWKSSGSSGSSRWGSSWGSD